MKVLWTNRFSRRLRKYNGLQDFTAASVAKLLYRRSQNTNAWSLSLKKLTDGSFGNLTVYASDITKGDRLIFMIEKNTLILLDLGNHDIQQDYAHMSQSTRLADIATASSVEPWFRELISNVKAPKSKKIDETIKSAKATPIISAGSGAEAFRWWQEAELNETWIQYLDDQQANVSEKIFSKITSKPKDFQVFYVCGGPGTGKTVILLNLAINLSHTKMSVGFELSNPVKNYLNSGKQKVPGVNFDVGEAEVHLIDDPVSSDRLNELIKRAKLGSCRALVVALDPLQWHERDTRFAAFNRLMNAEASFRFDLNVCYRQSYNVGKEVLEISRNIFTKSSKSLDKVKTSRDFEEIKPYLELVTEASFVDASGRTQVYETFSESLLETELRRFTSREDIWSHTSPIAFVFDDVLSNEYRDLVKQKTVGMNKVDLKLSSYKRIRGVEFQELYVFLSRSYWKKLYEGAQGLDRSDWERLTCLYTVISRPKDCLVIFVVD